MQSNKKTIEHLWRCLIGYYTPHKALIFQIKWTSILSSLIIFLMTLCLIGIAFSIPHISKYTNNWIILYGGNHIEIAKDKSINQDELFTLAIAVFLVKCFFGMLIIFPFILLFKFRCGFVAYINHRKKKLLIEICINPIPLSSYKFLVNNPYHDRQLPIQIKQIIFSKNKKIVFPNIDPSKSIFTTNNLSFAYHSEAETFKQWIIKTLEKINPLGKKIKSMVWNNKNSPNNIIKNFNLSINAGKFTTILGCNGSSKSSFLKLMARLLEKYKGEMTWITAEAKKIKLKEFYKNISYVSQDNIIPNEITVYDYVACGLFPYLKFFKFNYPKDNKVVLNNLEKIGLLQYKDRKLKNLSGGEKQKAILASILTQQTPVIILDEPTSFLDINAQYKILEILKTLQKEENKTIIAVLHDIRQAEQFSDEIILLKNGEVYDYGETKKVITKQNIENVFEVPWD